MSAHHTPRATLRAPEGRWVQGCERRATINFVPDMAVQLTLAAAGDAPWWAEGDGAPPSPPELLLFNTQQFLYVHHPAALDRVRCLLRLAACRGGGRSGPLRGRAPWLPEPVVAPP